MNTTRVYNPNARIAHIVDDATIFRTVAAAIALCGKTAPIGGWHGTGTFAERQEAERRVTCRACAEAVR